jgi:hypothetical protein
MNSDTLSNISKVVETHSPDEVNELLGKGWRLINVYTGSFSYDVSDQLNIYVLGRPDEYSPL